MKVLAKKQKCQPICKTIGVAQVIKTHLSLQPSQNLGHWWLIYVLTCVASCFEKKLLYLSKKTTHSLETFQQSRSSHTWLGHERLGDNRNPSRRPLLPPLGTV